MAIYMANTSFDYAGQQIRVGDLIEDDSYLFTRFPSNFTAFPVAAPTTFTQTYASAASAVPAATAAAVATTASTQTTPFGFTTQAQADALVTAVNALVADSLANRQLINAIIDAMQAARFAL